LSTQGKAGLQAVLTVKPDSRAALGENTKTQNKTLQIESANFQDRTQLLNQALQSNKH